MWSDPFTKNTQKDIGPHGSQKGSHVTAQNNRGHEMALALTAILISLVLWVTAAEAAPRVEAPDFELVALDGKSYSKASLRDHLTLLVFWAPWCHFCQLELPKLAKIYRENKPEQLRILTIAFADTRANVEAYLKAHPDTFPFPTAYDTNDRIAQKFGVSATPTFVVMNKQGNLILAHFGARVSQNPKYQAFLNSLRK